MDMYASLVRGILGFLLEQHATEVSPEFLVVCIRRLVCHLMTPVFLVSTSVATAEVKITQTGSRSGGSRAANDATNFDKTSERLRRHHHQDGTTMQLVLRDIQSQTGHTGGFQPRL